MITLHATAAGVSLHPFLQAASWQGEIVAVFRRSILCTTANGRLLHLHTGPQLVSPFGIRFEGDVANVLRAPSLVRGGPVRKNGAAIDIAEHIHLTLDAVRYYQSPIHRIAVVDTNALKLAWQLLRMQGRHDGFERLPGAQTIIAAMQQAILRNQLDQMLAAMRRLIGWGPGLTPSGDDVFVGCLRGLWLLGKNQPALSEMLDRCHEALLPDLHTRTTSVGAEFIRYALHGAFAEVLDQVALSLLDASHPLMVQTALNRLLAQGETSGTDTMLGLLACLDALWPIIERQPRDKPQDAPSILLTSTAACR